MIPDLSYPKLLALVTEALDTIGGHPSVPFEVTHVELEEWSIRIWLTLHFLRATPVCCAEVQCYIGFLGMDRGDVPGMIASVLGLAEAPRVTIFVRTHHEAGYEYLHYGTPVDETVEFEDTRFSEDDVCEDDVSEDASS